MCAELNESFVFYLLLFVGTLFGGMWLEEKCARLKELRNRNNEGRNGKH